MEDRWKRITTDSVFEIIETEELSTPARGVLKPGMRPEAFVRVLEGLDLWLDATRVMAHALPSREAVWWGCVCARQTVNAEKGSAEQAALSAAVKWVYKPNDENRVLAFRRAAEADPESPLTMAALAAAFSKRSLALPDDQNIEVDETAFPGMIFSLVYTAANDDGEEQAENRFRAFLQSAEEVACGRTGKIEGMKG